MHLLNKDNNNFKFYHDKAVVMIPELEDHIGIDMSCVSFEKQDLPCYFYVNVYEDRDNLSNRSRRTFQYNFETELGAGQVVVSDAGSSLEKIWVNDVVNRVASNNYNVELQLEE